MSFWILSFPVTPSAVVRRSIDVRFPVFGPGQVDLPEIFVNGEQLDLLTLYWEGNTSFVAAGADIRDEEIYGAALPCTLAYMVMAEVPSLSIG